MNETQKLREALRRIKHESASLADAQVIALEALSLPTQAEPVAQLIPMTESERADMACAVAQISTGCSVRNVAALAIEWTEQRYGISSKEQTTPQPAPACAELPDERDKVDAERYRWLRDESYSDIWDFGGCYPRTGLDAAIDAAIRALKD
jgi:hypothetical protein